MRQVITHPGNVDPRYLRLQGQQVWRNRSHRLADFDEADSDCIEHHPVVKGAAVEVGIDCRCCGKNVLEPLIIPAAHRGIASASTLPRIPGLRASPGTTSTSA
jgi:hypothetical protein